MNALSSIGAPVLPPELQHLAQTRPGERPPPAKVKTAQDRALWDSCRVMERQFATMLMGEVTKSMPAVASGTPGADIYSGMIQSTLAEQVAASGSLGLSQRLYDSLRAKTPHASDSVPSGKLTPSVQP
jgi:Rod binding domain-containing protein